MHTLCQLVTHSSHSSAHPYVACSTTGVSLYDCITTRTVRLHTVVLTCQPYLLISIPLVSMRRFCIVLLLQSMVALT